MRRRIRRTVEVVRVGKRGIAVLTAGFSLREARRIYMLVAAAAAGYLWTQSGIVAAVSFAVTTGLLQSVLVPNEPRRGDSKPMPAGAWGVIGAGCLWNTVSSAVLVALIMRTVGVPFLQGFATCYVVSIGSAGFAWGVRMAIEDKKSFWK